MKSTLASSTWNDAIGKEYRWKNNGADGLRSYSYNASNPNWNYAKIAGTEDKGYGSYYLFTDSSTGKPSARRGNLYNWTAATLGSSLIFTSDDYSGQHAADSICPHGWQLPIAAWRNASSVNKTFDKLLLIYNISDNVTSANRSKELPLEYLPAGSYYYGHIYSHTTVGSWWSGTYKEDNSAFALETNAPNIITDDGELAGEGHALRCVAHQKLISKDEGISIRAVVAPRPSG